MPSSSTFSKTVFFLLALALFASPTAVFAGDNHGGFGFRKADRSAAYGRWHDRAGQRPDGLFSYRRQDRPFLALIPRNGERRHAARHHADHHHAHSGKGHHGKAHHGKGHHGKGHHAHHGKGHQGHHGKRHHGAGDRRHNDHHWAGHHGRRRACRQVTDIGYRHGHKALLGATACYDRHGNAYIVGGSRTVIQYIN